MLLSVKNQKQNPARAREESGCGRIFIQPRKDICIPLYLDTDPAGFVFQKSFSTV
jgi:hypothetical protein